MYKILIADDEIKIRATVKDYLSAKGFDVAMAKDGADAVDFAEKENFDLIILDVLMPRKDGLLACREIRTFSDVPILFLSALGEEEDLLKGYSLGADDYIVKPFPLSVLTEKIGAMIKRHKGVGTDGRLTLQGISLDLKTREVLVCGRKIILTNKDFSLLHLLMLNRGTVLSREMIISKIWSYDFDGDDRVVDTHIKRLRKALGEKADCIVTVTGVGYSFKKEE